MAVLGDYAQHRQAVRRPFSDRAGAQCTSGSAPAPAGAVHRPAAMAPNTRSCQRQRRQRCMAMRASSCRSSRSPRRQAVAWTAAAKSASARSASVPRPGSGRPPPSRSRVGAEGAAPVVYQARSGRFVMPHVATAAISRASLKEATANGQRELASSVTTIGITSVNFISPRAIDITARRTKSDRLMPVSARWEFNCANSAGLSQNETICGC